VIPVATLVELLDTVPERHRALLLLATFANLRFGELAALRRGQVDLDACEVRVTASLSEMDDGRLIVGDPKSHAGTRTVSFPADIVPELADHLERFADPKPKGLVFIGPKDGRLRRSNFRETWERARDAIGMPELPSTIFAIPGTRWRRRKGPASRNSWSGWVTPAHGPR
jgi:integrase